MKTIPFKKGWRFRVEKAGRFEVQFNSSGGYFRPLDDIKIIPEKEKSDVPPPPKH